MKKKKPRFGIIGMGFISDRHVRAIEEIGGELVVCCDNDPKKINKIPRGCQFFTDWLKIKNVNLDYVVICTPNYLHTTMASHFQDKFKVICEKPLVIDPRQLDILNDNVNCVMQLRYDPQIQEIKSNIDTIENNVLLDLQIHRDDWYWEGWKGKEDESGGLLYNIGVHYLDIIVQLFYEYADYHRGRTKYEIKKLNNHEAHIIFKFKKTHVNFKISLDAPMDNQYRKFIINGKQVNLNRNIEGLHTQVYKEVLADKGIKPKDVKTTLSLIEEIYATNKADTSRTVPYIPTLN